MKLYSAVIASLCMAMGAMSAPGQGASPAAPRVLNIDQAVQVLKDRSIISESIPSQKEKSKELLQHLAAFEQGKESINDYPYIDTVLSLYRSAMEGDWVRVPASALRAFHAQGCKIRDLAACCRSIASIEVPDAALLACLLNLGLQQGAALNSRTATGETPLSIAVRAGVELSIINDMLTAGADVNAKTRHEWTPLMYAAHDGRADIARLLIGRGASVNERNNRGESALIIAAGRCQEDVCHALLAAGADVNATNYDGNSALITCAQVASLEQQSDFLPIIEMLLTAGADVNGANFNGWTPLILASRNGAAAHIERYLQAGAKVNARDVNGMSALLVASGNGRIDVCRMLLAAGADVDLGDNSGLTPLMIAAVARLEDVCKLLLEAGADKDAKNDAGATARDFAQTPELKALLD